MVVTVLEILGTIPTVRRAPRAIRRWNTEFGLALEGGAAWGACRVWLDTEIGRRDFKPRELLLRAVPPSPTVQVSRVSVLMHATGFQSLRSLNVSSYHADIRGFMQVRILSKLRSVSLHCFKLCH